MHRKLRARVACTPWVAVERTLRGVHRTAAGLHPHAGVFVQLQMELRVGGVCYQDDSGRLCMGVCGSVVACWGSALVERQHRKRFIRAHVQAMFGANERCVQ